MSTEWEESYIYIGVAMSRDIGEELSESDEEELIEPEQGDKGDTKETDLEDELEASDIEVNLSKRDQSNEPANVWSGPVTRSRLRAQEKTLQDLAKFVGASSKGEDQDKPACWFNLISM